MIPWGHHKVIMDKCRDDQQKALFFVQKTLEKGEIVLHEEDC